MMNRKKLTNKEKFVFDEAEIVMPLGKSAVSKRPSVQKRLCPKAETKKPAFNPPIPRPGPSPFTPVRNIRGDRMRPRGEYKECLTTDPCVEEIVAKLTKFKECPTTDPCVEEIVAKFKECPTTDPCVEEVVAKLAKFNMESPSNNLLQPTKSFSKEVFDPFESYHKRIYSSQNPNKPGEDFANSDDGNARERKFSAPFWKTPDMLKPRSPLTPPPSPDDEVMKVKRNIEKKEDNVASCICMRPLKLILCPVCSHTLTGRLRKTCQVHPAALYLLDIEACPRCKETKFVLKEYELPDGFIPVLQQKLI